MAVISCKRVTLLLSVWFLFMGVPRSTGATVWIENELYQSGLWTKASTSLLAVKQDSISQEVTSVWKNQLNETDIVLIEVACSDGETRGDICSTLSHHVFAVRPRGSEPAVIQGVDIPSEYSGKDMAYLLQFILNDRITFISSYSELKEVSAQHNQFLLTYTINTVNDEFVELMKVLLTNEFHLVVTTDVSAVPLTHRPHYTSSPLVLWHISVTGLQWLRLQDQAFGSKENVESLRETFMKFLNRIRFPTVVEYSEELMTSLSGNDFHTVYVFPGLDPYPSVNIKQLVHTVLLQLYTDFIFILGQRDTDIARRLYVTDDVPEPQIVILPFGEEERMTSLPIQSDDLGVEVDGLKSVLNSFRNDNQKTADGGIAPILVSLLDPMFLSDMFENGQLDHMNFMAFCKKGDPNCPPLPFDTLSDSLIVLQGAKTKSQIGQLVGQVVECQSVEDIQMLEFSSLPCYGLYNSTDKKWYRREGELSTVRKVYELIAAATGLGHKFYLDVLSAAKESTEAIIYDEPSPPSALKEDDHFGLLLKTLPPISLPPEIVLTSSTFDDYIKSHDRTVVVFHTQWCVRSQVFLHHVLAAHKRLDQAQSASVAAVNCADYTDVCLRFRVTTFPTPFVFTPSTLDTPTPLTVSLTALDSAHILQALERDPRNIVEELAELLPSTLPRLLTGSLTIPLVLWCDSDVNSKLGDVYKRVATHSKEQSDLSFAWINSSKYSELLSKMVGSGKMTYPTVLAIMFDHRTVFQLSVPGASSEEQFEDSFSVFLDKLTTGELTPSGKLPHKEWPPLTPPIPFPSPKEYLGLGDEDDFTNVPYNDKNMQMENESRMSPHENEEDSDGVDYDENMQMEEKPHTMLRESEHTEL